MELEWYVVVCYNAECSCERQHNRVALTTNPQATRDSLPCDPCIQCARIEGPELVGDANWQVRVTLGPFAEAENAHSCAHALCTGTRGWQSKEKKAAYLSQSGHFNVSLWQGVPPGITAPLRQEFTLRRLKERVGCKRL